jgi:hypothetical protein
MDKDEEFKGLLTYSAAQFGMQVSFDWNPGYGSDEKPITVGKVQKMIELLRRSAQSFEEELERYHR